MFWNVYPYKRNETTGEMVDLEKQPKHPGNDLFGFEIWRVTVWGATSLRRLNSVFLNSLKHQDIFAEVDEIQQLKKELKTVKNNIVNIAKGLGFEVGH